MDKSTVLEKLREYEPELKAAGIMRLSLFGSVARGDASSESDVDLMADFDPTRQFSLLEMVGLENRLTDILGVRVELTPARALKGRIRERVTREAVFAF
ncbi:MAG: nucleotidyltransferase family protein [Acidobacteria bacterium]|nr:nucleotidyltransferase family protein [Acidobacteriota bacterium]